MASLRPLRIPAGERPSDVTVVCVEPVEREVDVAHRALEVADAVDLVEVEPLERDRRLELVKVRRACLRDRDGPALDGRARLDWAVDAPVHAQMHVLWRREVR